MVNEAELPSWQLSNQQMWSKVLETGGQGSLLQPNVQ